MENNIYAQHKQEVKAICDREGVDIGVACAMLRHEKGWFPGEKDPQLDAFVGMLADMKGEQVAAYFAE